MHARLCATLNRPITRATLSQRKAAFLVLLKVDKSISEGDEFNFLQRIERGYFELLGIRYLADYGKRCNLLSYINCTIVSGLSNEFVRASTTRMFQSASRNNLYVVIMVSEFRL